MKTARESCYVTIARLLRPRGNRGELVAENLSNKISRAQDDSLKNFSKLGAVFFLDSNQRRQETAIEQAWVHQGRLILKLKGVDSIDAAERLRNVSLQIPQEHLGPAPDDGYYFKDLIGCAVHDIDDGHLIGLVEEVLEPGGPLLLQVTLENREVLIPFVKDICVDIAPERKIIRARMPDGLESLNL